MSIALLVVEKPSGLRKIPGVPFVASAAAKLISATGRQKVTESQERRNTLSLPQKNKNISLHAYLPIKLG